MIPNTFTGTFTALVTPFSEDAVDYATLRALVQRQIDGGIDGLVPVGTTGESPTLSNKEHLGVIETTVEVAGGKVPVIAGTGANSTAEALELTREADILGADAFLQVAPYYNKPGPEGLFRHFAAIAEVTEKPIILYSIPGRCGIEIPVSVIKRLAEEFPHVRSIKEAGGTVTRVQQIRAECGDLVQILCGDDGLTIPFIASGAQGVISVASNLAPRIIGRITRLALEDDFAGARKLAEQYYNLLTEMVFIEGNPTSIKTCMDLTGVLSPYRVRLPLAEASAANREKLRQLLASIDLSEDVS